MKTKLLLILLILTCLVVSCNNKNNGKSQNERKKYSFEVAEEDLATAYSNFKTKIVNESFEGDGEPMTPPEDIFSLIYYPAKDGEMAAFLTPNPNNGKKNPAVIWLVGGYGGIGNDDYFWSNQPIDNDQTGSAFRKDGIVLMIPSFRGENNNPGNYEMFYGEIIDLESAREYLSQLSYVDPNRIYVVGHSTGGTKALLGNEHSKGFRAAFSIGGIPDLELRIKKRGNMMVEVPFDQKNPQEFRIRSPRTFIKSIKSPTFYFEGEESFWPEFNELQKVANDNNIPFFIYKIKGGNHFNIITPVTELIAKKILNDTGGTTNIKFDKNDISEIEKSLKY